MVFMKLITTVLAFTLASVFHTCYGQNQTANPFLKVCISDMHPMITCDVGAEHSTKFNGFDFMLWQQIAGLMLWSEGVHYNYTCASDYFAVLAAIEKPNSACDVALNGITITQSRIDAGIRFSYPYLPTSLAIVVPGYMDTTSGWDFFKPFSSSLWIALGLTILMFPVVLFCLEFLAMKRKLHLGDFPAGVEEATVRSLWTLIGTETLEVSTLGARIFVLCFAFMSLILGSSYTANLAAVLTVRSVNTNIRNVYDLKGRAVATQDVYKDVLKQQYFINSAANFTLDSEPERLAAFQEVSFGSLAAVVVPAPLAYHVFVHFPGCTFQVLKDTFHPMSYGIAFSPSVSQELIDKISAHIMYLGEKGTIEEYTRRFITNPHSNACENLIAESIDFKDVYGLWVILAAGLAVGAIIMLIMRWHTTRTKSWDEDDDDDGHDLGLADSLKPNGGPPGFNGGIRPMAIRRSMTFLKPSFINRNAIPLQYHYYHDGVNGEGVFPPRSASMPRRFNSAARGVDVEQHHGPPLLPTIYGRSGSLHSDASGVTESSTLAGEDNQKGKVPRPGNKLGVNSKTNKVSALQEVGTLMGDKVVWKSKLDGQEKI